MSTTNAILIIAMIFLIVLRPLPVMACATCGCSEVCPIAMAGADSLTDSTGLVSDSIWGNIILKMAYSHDAELQKLIGRRRLVSAGTVGVLAGVAGATAGQGIVSIGTLNPPDGHEDSYAPGIVGLCLEGVVNLALTGNLILHHSCEKKVKIRQLEIRRRAESILVGLEAAGSSSEEIRAELTELIGRQGADEYLQLWRSSHSIAMRETSQGAESHVLQSPLTEPVN